jgi:acyl-coenzyme A thioesterase PaaI-like protein
VTPAAPADELLDAVERLVTDIRSLMRAAAETDVDPADIQHAQQLVTEATELLSHRSRDHGLRRHLDRAAIERTNCGEPWQVFRHNPLGIPLVITVDNDRATAGVQTSPLLEGPPRILHGGFTAAMMDALLSTLVQAQGVRAVTVKLDIAFMLAVPLDQDLDLEAEIKSIEGRKIWTEGRVLYNGDVAARADALFIEIAGEPD